MVNYVLAGEILAPLEDVTVKEPLDYVELRNLGKFSQFKITVSGLTSQDRGNQSQPVLCWTDQDGKLRYINGPAHKLGHFLMLKTSILTEDISTLRFWLCLCVCVCVCVCERARLRACVSLSESVFVYMSL